MMAHKKVYKNYSSSKKEIDSISLSLCLLLFGMVMSGLMGCSAETREWLAAQEVNNIEVLEEYLKKYPDGKFSEEAILLISWLQTTSENTIKAYVQFLEDYELSEFAVEARERLAAANLEKEEFLRALEPIWTEFITTYRSGSDAEKDAAYSESSVNIANLPIPATLPEAGNFAFAMQDATSAWCDFTSQLRHHGAYGDYWILNEAGLVIVIPRGDFQLMSVLDIPPEVGIRVVETNQVLMETAAMLGLDNDL